MKLGWVLLYVPDAKRAADFYQRAFGFELAFMNETGTYAALKTGETTLGFVAQSFVRDMLPGGIRPAQNDEAPPPFEVALTTDDVAAAQTKAVAAGARHVMAPTKKPWGQTVAYVRDLDGNLVEICTPMG